MCREQVAKKAVTASAMRFSVTEGFGLSLSLCLSLSVSVSLSLSVSVSLTHPLCIIGRTGKPTGLKFFAFAPKPCDPAAFEYLL